MRPARAVTRSLSDLLFELFDPRLRLALRAFERRSLAEPLAQFSILFASTLQLGFQVARLRDFDRLVLEVTRCTL